MKSAGYHPVLIFPLVSKYVSQKILGTQTMNVSQNSTLLRNVLAFLVRGTARVDKS